MRPIKVRFAKEILAEVLPPKKPTHKVLLLLTGMPSNPFKNHVMGYWAKKGYWVINPRYRGTWESEGVFLKDSPVKDVLDIIDELPRTLKDEWTGIEMAMPDNPAFYIVGASFGGATALIASKDSRIKKVAALTPVTDFTAPSKDEPIEHFPIQVKRAFGDAFRADPEGWSKVARGELFNPMKTDGLDGSKILIIHSNDDTIVDRATAKRFTDKVGNRLIIFKKGGHLGIGDSTKRPYRKQILKFLRP